jgi:hypothetical protein
MLGRNVALSRRHPPARPEKASDRHAQPPSHERDEV